MVNGKWLSRKYFVTLTWLKLKYHLGIKNKLVFILYFARFLLTLHVLRKTKRN